MSNQDLSFKQQKEEQASVQQPGPRMDSLLDRMSSRNLNLQRSEYLRIIHQRVMHLSNHTHHHRDTMQPKTSDLQITTRSGNIQVNGISGKMSLLSNAGSIRLTVASLSGSSTVKSYAGSITYTGSLSKTGSYDFDTNSGSITMTLPSDSSFHLNALTYAGSIQTSFPVAVKHTGAVASANGDVGDAPQATLKLKTYAGSISL